MFETDFIPNKRLAEFELWSDKVVGLDYEVTEYDDNYSMLTYFELTRSEIKEIIKN